MWNEYSCVVVWTFFSKECSSYCTTVLISHASKVMLKILEARLQQSVKQELPDVQAGFWRSRRIRDRITNICWIMEKARNIYFCFSDNIKVFCLDHNKLWKILKELGIRDHLTYILQNLYAIQETTDRTGHGTMGWFKIGKGVCPGCTLSPCLFNLYAEYILWNAGWMNYKLESRLPGEISTTLDMQMIAL